jgi:hypothetical protein
VQVAFVSLFVAKGKERDAIRKAERDLLASVFKSTHPTKI